jgi:hypothetical protein
MSERQIYQGLDLVSEVTRCNQTINFSLCSRPIIVRIASDKATTLGNVKGGDLILEKALFGADKGDGGD